MLLEITTLVMLAAVTAVELIPGLRQQLFWVTQVFTPVIFGLAVLILIELPRLGRLDRRGWLTAAALGATILGLIAYYFVYDPSALLMYLPGGAVCLGAAWLVSARPSRWVWLLPFVALLLWVIFNNYSDAAYANIPQPLAWLLAPLMFLAPGLSVAVMAVFVHTGLRMLFQLSPEAGPRAQRISRIEGALRLLAALLLLALVIYSTVWASIWDQTSDGMGGLLIAMLVSVTAIACGMVIGVRAGGWWRLSGLLFAGLVAAGTYAGFEAGWQFSFPTLTEQRAERIARALERFNQREQRYPQTLDELVPWDLLSVPQPIMFRGEGWCYQGSPDAFVLAAFHHEYFGLPVSLPVYASSGYVAGQPLPCQERLAAMQQRYDWTRSIPQTHSSPTPDPRLSSGAQGEHLVPVYASQNNLLPGGWSSDGRWWFFREVQPGGAQVRLVFVDANGHVCPVEQLYAYDSFTGGSSAWLDDHRLLYLDGGPQPAVLTPCVDGAGRFFLPAGVTLTKINAVSPVNGHVLLQSKDRYWLLDGPSMRLREIPGVQPVTYDAHWDHAAWDPAGERVAISHLNSRQPKDGSTLYLVDGETLEITLSQALDLASEQSAPFVEWLSRDELLLHGPEALLRLDLTVTPPRAADLIEEVFDLSLKYPAEVHSMASLADRGGGYSLVVWVNKPRNQNLYVFQSRTRQVTAYQPGDQALLVLPDGQWLPLWRIAEPAQPADLISFIQAGSAEAAPLEITVAGHLPRAYPQLEIGLLPGAERLVVSSSNGVSLVSLPGGEQLHFWDTGGTDIAPALVISPDGSAVFSSVNGSGVFRIPVDH